MTTAGQLLVNSVLPPDLRRPDHVLDKKGIQKLLQEVADKHPEKFSQVLFDLSRIGHQVAYDTGGHSFGLAHLRPTAAARATQADLGRQVQAVYADPTRAADDRRAAVVALLGDAGGPMQKQLYADSLAEDNPLAVQVASGARGNQGNLRSLRGGDLMYVDHRNRPIPVPVLRSYAQGLSPAEFLAGSFGARKGVVDAKLCLFERTKVLMADYSEKEIRNVVVGDLIMGADRSGRTFPVRVTNVFDNGPRLCYRYRFRRGSQGTFIEVTATEDHKVLSQIRAGHAAYAYRSVYEPTPLPLSRALLQTDSGKNEYGAWVARGETRASGRVREPHALLAGLMLGDGCMAPSASSCFQFSCDDSTLLADSEASLAAVNAKFSKTGSGYSYVLQRRHSTGESRQVDTGRGHRQVETHPAKEWLERLLGLAPAHEKKLPVEVWGWDDESVSDLVAGLFSTDGCVSVRRGGVTLRFFVSSRELAEGLARLLTLRLGVWTSEVKVSLRVGRSKNAKHDLWGFDISHPEMVRRFAERVPLVGVKRLALAAALPAKQGTAKDQFGCKVHDRELVGEVPTFDLEVDHPDHLFVLANGLIVSNSVMSAGFLSKQLVQGAHRLVVTDLDGDGEPDVSRGLPVDASDPDNEGALLAAPAGGYPRNTVLTPKIMADIRGKVDGDILVRSPTVGGPAVGGVYGRDVGIRERGEIPPRGDFVGIAAAQAAGEPLSQAQLCLAEGTLVRMADWTVKAIEDVVPGDVVMGSDTEANLFPVAVTNRFDNGEKECVETVFGVASTRERISLVSTGDHKLLAETRYWHPTNQIVERGMFPVSEKCVGFGGLMPRSVQNDGFGKPEPFALLLGLLLGDGCYTPSVHGVHLSCFDPFLVEDVEGYLSGLGLKATKLAGQKGYYRISQIKDQPTLDPVTGQTLPGDRNPATKFLKAHGLYGKYAHDKVLPDVVWQWDQSSVLQVLAGLFATDGSFFVSSQSKEVGSVHAGFGSTSLAMLQQVRDLLRIRFAVHAGPISSQSKGRKRPLYSFVVTRRPEVVRLLSLLPMVGIKKRTIAKFREAWKPVWDRDTSRYYRKEQKPVGLRRTFDIEVDHPAHLFVLANGLLVSNSSKHAGGVAGASKGSSGFALINALTQVPKTFPGGAAHASKDGRVTAIRPAPQGGHFVAVDGVEHHVGTGLDPTVKVGDEVEAGDVLSEGTPNPAEIVRHKGVGEGRRYFVQAFKAAYDGAGIPVHRRNVELIARGLIDHVRMTDETDDYLPDDVVPYSRLEAAWRPRDGHTVEPPKKARGMYIDRPVLHYTVGTRVTPSVIARLERHGVAGVTVHPDPPPFEPEMVRGMESLSKDPDWVTRMMGAYQQKSLLRGVHRGDESDEAGTSYVPALARGRDFGRVGAVVGFTPPPAPPRPPAPRSLLDGILGTG